MKAPGHIKPTLLAWDIHGIIWQLRLIEEGGAILSCSQHARSCLHILSLGMLVSNTDTLFRAPAFPQVQRQSKNDFKIRRFHNTHLLSLSGLALLL